jgi:hypothetical protein
MRLTQRQGKKRHGLSVDRWSVPFISTSNVSVYDLLDHTRMANYQAYTDRLMDVPTPNGRTSFFANLHGRKDAATFGKYLFDLATMNFGYPGRVFLARLTSALAKDRAGLAAVVARNVAKYEAAAAAITSPKRDVLRVRGYFATVYAVGCLAIRFTILPFTEAELLAAVLSCHRDHVAFVDNEVAGGPTWSVDAAGAPEYVAEGSARKPVASVPNRSPFDRLRRYINRNRQRPYSKHSIWRGFIDLRSPGLSRLRFKLKLSLRRSRGQRVVSYAADGEYWIPGGRFEKVAGGASEVRDLKQELLRRGLLVTTRRGRSISYVVKRPLPDGSRPLFVVIRHKPKKPSSQVVAAAPMV